ncbi:MAG: peptidylprolyl isomerase [Ignavibacteria bacterium]
MSKNKITLLLTVFAALILLGCGQNKETSKTEIKTTENKSTTTITTKTDSINTSQTQTQMKDSSMTKTETAGKDDASKKGDGNFVNMETTMGKIKIKLFTEQAPITTGNFKKLVNEGFYDGIIFHRVIDGFMIQGGDPTGTGTGGSKDGIKDEFGAGLKHSKKGMLSMANRGPNTGTSQFFITLAPTPHLDGKHAIFGEVVEGMDIVEKIGKTKTGPNDKPAVDVKMTKVTVSDK